MKTELLFNPFRYIAGFKALVSGTIILFATAVLGSFNKVHFDGVIDIHTGVTAPTWFFLTEVISSWLIVAFLLYIAALVISKSKVRLVDVFGTQALAKYPFFIISAISFIPLFQFTFQGIPEIEPRLLLFMVISLAVTIWSLILMYNAFSVSANVKGRTAIITFIAVIVIAEILSKILLYKLYSTFIIQS